MLGCQALGLLSRSDPLGLTLVTEPDQERSGGRVGVVLGCLKISTVWGWPVVIHQKTVRLIRHQEMMLSAASIA